MKQVTISQLKKMKVEEIKDGGCFEVVADGEHLFYAIVGAEQEMRSQIIGRASMIDASRGK